MDRGALWATAHGVTKSQTRLVTNSTQCCRWTILGWLYFIGKNIIQGLYYYYYPNILAGLFFKTSWKRHDLIFMLNLFSSVGLIWGIDVKNHFCNVSSRSFCLVLFQTWNVSYKCKYLLLLKTEDRIYLINGKHCQDDGGEITNPNIQLTIINQR